MSRPLSRRRFLGALGAGAGGVLLGAGCSSSDDDDSGRAGGGRLPSVAPSDVDGPVFTLGVASGSPTTDGIVLWTRLAPAPLEAGGGMPADADADVDWEIATDAAFSEVLASGTERAPAAEAHSLHVFVDSLERGVEHHYRFRFGDEVSPTGRFRLSEIRSTSARLVVASCQGIEWGHHAAWLDAAEADPDLVVFLGDYIYEYAPGTVVAADRAATAHAGTECVTLEQYRQRYAQYHLSPGLQAAHAAAAWTLTWDDHEVTDNHTGSDPEDTDPAAWAERRAAAARAHWEHLPLRHPAPSGPDLRRYDLIDLGLHVRIHQLETRQWASPVPCRGTGQLDRGPLCDEARAESHSILGERQEAWLDAALSSSPTRWNLVASPVQVAGVGSSAFRRDESPWFYRDAWDGYPGSRRRLAESLAAAERPVVVSGDYHSAFVSEVRADPWDDPEGPVVATELTATAISSLPFGHEPDLNPHIAWADKTNGHLLLELGPDDATATFRVVDDVMDASSGSSTSSRWRINPDPATAPERLA